MNQDLAHIRKLIKESRGDFKLLTDKLNKNIISFSDALSNAIGDISIEEARIGYKKFLIEIANSL